MEAKQFYSRSISPLVTKPFSCKWSEDDQLAIVTEKGVHIFNLIPAPTQAYPILNIRRTFMNSPENLPGEIYAEDVISEICKWPKEQIYSFLMHDAYTPTFPKTNKMVPEIIDVFWSPQKLFHSHKCVIAVTTSSGSVELAIEINKSWISIYEFTDAWAKIINKDLEAVEDGAKLDYDSLKEKFQRLLTTTLTWSCLYYELDGVCFAYLIIAHRNSEIAIWKIHKITSDVNIDTNANVELKFKKKLISANIKITSLLWVHLDEKNYILIVGYYNGQFGILKLKEFEGGLTSDSYSTCYSDVDNIPIDYLEVLRQTDKWLEVLVVKGMHILILVIDFCGKMISMKFISSPGFSITGVSVIDSSMIIVTTQDGSLNAISKSQDQQELICTPIKMDLLKSQVQFLGLAQSRNKLIFTLITSPSMMYDHLTERDPSSVYFFNIKNLPGPGPLDILYKSEAQSLLKCWDCLELLKINALKYNDLPQILTRISLDLESLSLHELRVAYWIMTINETWKKKNYSEPALTPPEEIEQCRTYIFLHTASHHLSHLARLENLTQEQRLCMSLLRAHLDIWLSGEEEEIETPLLQLVRQVLEATNRFDSLQQEKCNFCNVVIIEPWSSTCSSGHKLPRCAITCLQVTGTKFRTCLVCREVFHPCLDLEMSEVRCLYCDLLVFYRNETLDSSILASKKNLSKKRTPPVVNKESKEEEI